MTDIVLILIAILCVALLFFFIKNSPKKDFIFTEESLKKEEEPTQKVFTIQGNISFTMVRIEGGTFQMGFENSKATQFTRKISPIHEVKLSSFRIGLTEVTQELWESIMCNNPSTFKGGQLPVTGVSWDDCQEFIARLNTLTGEKFRLPTEAEWEFAARGGLMSRRYKYAGSDSVSMVAWNNQNSHQRPHPVGSLLPNELGLFDMSGNVFEWCNDWYAMDYYSKSVVTNPQGPDTGIMKVMRGGCYTSDAEFCNTRERFARYPSLIQEKAGFRLAL